MAMLCSNAIHHLVGKIVKQLYPTPFLLIKPRAKNLDVYTRVRLILLKPLITLLLQPEMQNWSARKALHDSTVHISILDICHDLSYSADELRGRPSSHGAFLYLQSYLHFLLNFSVIVSRPTQTATTIHLRSQNYPITDTLSMVWQVQYGEWLHPDHSYWISSLMQNAFVAVTATPVGPADEETHLTTILNCLSVLCTLRQFARYLTPEMYNILFWAITHKSILIRHCSLRFISVVCGADQSMDGMRRLVEGMGGIARFSEVLTSVGPALSDDSTCTPSYYLWIQAYLDIVGVLASEEGWVEYVLSDGHADRCLAFAGYLAASAGESPWGVNVTAGGPSLPGRTDYSPISEFIGWDSDPHRKDFAPTSHRYYKNPYIRSVWRSLVEILVRCDRHRPGFIAIHHHAAPHVPDLRVAVACVAWQISDTHPLLHNVRSLIEDYTQEVIGGFYPSDFQNLDELRERVDDVLNVLSPENSHWQRTSLLIHETHQVFTFLSHRLGRRRSQME